MTSLTEIMQIIGGIAASSFVLIAMGDCLTSIINLLIQKLVAPKNTDVSRKIIFYWNLLKEIYADIRTFLNRISLYSRPLPRSLSSSSEDK